MSNMDRRDQAPSGYTDIEYGRVVYGRLPMSQMTRGESYCLKKYIDYLIDNVDSDTAII